MHIKHNFFVITGGPGAGKSTLLAALKEKGYPYITETGRQIIRARRSQGLPPRPAPEEFARQMFRLDYENFVRNADRDEILFFDRSFLDSAALLSQINWSGRKTLEHIIGKCRFNEHVFIAPPWMEIYAHDSERDQSFAEAANTYTLLYDWYAANGYKLVELPKVPVEERVSFVLASAGLRPGQ